MKKNQLGALDAVLFVTLAIVVAVGGYLIYRVSQEEVSVSSSVPQAQTQTTNDDSEQSDAANNSLVVEEEISLEGGADLRKLDGVAPQSFIDYIEPTITGIKANENSCINVYRMNTFSDVNISGSVQTIHAGFLEEGHGCGGAGARIVWSLVDGEWQELGYNNWPLRCSSIIDAQIYSEFIDVCLDDSSGEPQAGEEPIPNPNGSIQDA